MTSRILSQPNSFCVCLSPSKDAERAMLEVVVMDNDGEISTLDILPVVNDKHVIAATVAAILTRLVGEGGLK